MIQMSNSRLGEINYNNFDRRNDYMSMAFRQCSDCMWNKVGHYCGRQLTLNGFECINFDKLVKEVKVIKKDPHKDSEVRQDQLEYLKLKYLYEGEPIDYLDARVPFHYKDVKYQSMDIKDYIAMVEEIERREELEIIEILKERNIID